MANKRDNACIDEHTDNVSEISVESIDSVILEKNAGDSGHSSHSEKFVRKYRRTLLLFSDSEETDEDMETDWLNFDPPRNNDIFKGSLEPNIFPENIEKIEDFVGMFIGDDLLEFIVKETNRYYRQHICKYKFCEKTAKWFDVTVPELKQWFALIILMGLIKKSRINDYWTKNSLIETKIFAKTMARNRFNQILTFLHFSDDDDIPDNAGQLFQIQHIIDYFSKKFQENFKPGQNIFIHESIIPWHGKLNFKIYNPTKNSTCGILIRMLCDSSTGYISNFKLYSGAKKSLNRTILELLSHSVGKWHHLYLEKFYNSVKLSKILLKNQIRVCGAIRQNRGLPNSFKNKKLKTFETAFKRKGEILLQMWRSSKNKDIKMISTIHNAEIINTGKKYRKSNDPIQKPECIVDYDRHMNRVVRADRYLNFYPIYRKTIQWSKKAVLYLFHCALFNSFRVYKYKYSNVNPSKTLQFHDFLLKLCEAWIQNNLPKRNRYIPTMSDGLHQDLIQKLSSHQLKDHQLVLISETNKRKRRRCRVCYANKLQKTTNLMCKICKVPLHLNDCFVQYHLKEKH